MPLPSAYTVDEDGASLKNFPRDDESPQPITTIPGGTPLPFQIEDEGSPLKFFSRDDDEHSEVITVITGWTPTSYTEEEQSVGLKNFYRDDELAAIPTVTTGWNPTYSTEEETIARLGFGDEDPSFYPTVISGWAPLPYTDEEFPSGLKFFPRDGESPQPITISTWYCPYFTDEEVYNVVVAITVIEDDSWLQSSPSLLPPLYSFTIEDEGSPLKFFPREDDDDPQYPQPQPWPWGGPSYTDEEVWALFIPPITTISAVISYSVQFSYVQDINMTFTNVKPLTSQFVYVRSDNLEFGK